MKVGILYHKNTVPQEAVCKIVQLLGSVPSACFCSEEEIEGIDRLIVLGGDGAMLRAARRASALDVPLVGVNYGTVGFLTEFERGEEEAAVRLALDDGCALVRRVMLEAQVKGTSFYCLNEIAFMRRIAEDAEDGVVRIGVTVDGIQAGEFVADGLILCTPTGSTAYSLSAGGSILTPDCEGFLLTPVNAFSLRSRPIVCSDKSVFSFAFPEGTLAVHGDGKLLGEVHSGDVVTVKKSRRFATFLAKDRHDFFRRLTEKIN